MTESRLYALPSPLHGEQETRVDAIEQRIEAQDQRNGSRFEALQHTAARLEQQVLRLEGAHQRMDARLDQMTTRLDLFEQRTEVRFVSLEDKVSRQFVWTVGVHVTTFVGIVAALLSRSPW